MTNLRIVAVLAAFLLAACNKSDGKSDSPKPEAKAEPCPAGSFADPGGRFCAKLPAGYKIVEDKKGPGWPSAILNDDKDTGSVTIVFAPVDQGDAQLGYLAKEGQGEGEKITEQVDIADGKGKYKSVQDSRIGMTSAKAVVKGRKSTLICQDTWSDGAVAPAVDICKSLREQI